MDLKLADALAPPDAVEHAEAENNAVRQLAHERMSRAGIPERQ